MPNALSGIAPPQLNALAGQAPAPGQPMSPQPQPMHKHAEEFRQLMDISKHLAKLGPQADPQYQHLLEYAQNSSNPLLQIMTKTTLGSRISAKSEKTTTVDVSTMASYWFSKLPEDIQKQIGSEEDFQSFGYVDIVTGIDPKTGAEVIKKIVPVGVQNG